MNLKRWRKLITRATVCDYDDGAAGWQKQPAGYR